MKIKRKVFWRNQSFKPFPFIIFGILFSILDSRVSAIFSAQELKFLFPFLGFFEIEINFRIHGENSVVRPAKLSLGLELTNRTVK